MGKKLYCSSSGEESGGEGDGKEEEGGEGEGEGKADEGGEAQGEGERSGGEEHHLDLEILPVPRHHAIAPVNVPDLFPEVPILPISRNPLFPRFVKMLEARNR